jgi:hypothetical protein
MPDTYIKDGGNWKQVSEIHVKDGGTWKEVATGSVKDSGVWKEFHNLGPWGAYPDPENVSWSAGTTVSNPQQTSLSWPSGKNAFKAVIKGAGGGNSNGGQGASGGKTTLYLAKGTITNNLLLVVGDAGQYGNPAGPYDRVCGTTIGTCNDTYNDQIDERGIGGRPGRGFAPHNWGSSGGGFSGVFIDDNNTTSPQGYRYFYCTPVAIAGGGGGGAAYSIQGQTGGGHSITQGTHYFTRSVPFTATDVEDINFTYGIDIDSNTGCYSPCRIDTPSGGVGHLTQLYLRPFDGTGGAGFASSPYGQGGAGMVYGLNGVHLSELGFNRNASTLTKLTNELLVSPSSSTENGTGSLGAGQNSGTAVPGEITYYWGTI